MAKRDIYSELIEKIFFSRFEPGMEEVPFQREDFLRVAQELGVDPPKNLGDVIYSFRFRRRLPKTIRKKAPKGKQWTIRLTGHGKYSFVAIEQCIIEPSKMLGETKVPDATPGMVAKYALSDEQALLARLRYNRLIDIFTGVTCYSLQSHLRTTVPNVGQIETDELYVGVDKKGVHYVFPVQAKAGNDCLTAPQIEQDIAMCKHKFPLLVCRAIGAKFIEDDLIALFEFEQTENGIRIVSEKHYRLVPGENVTDADLKSYRERLQDNS